MEQEGSLGKIVILNPAPTSAPRLPKSTRFRKRFLHSLREENREFAAFEGK
jgi:hypothetical protein